MARQQAIPKPGSVSAEERARALEDFRAFQASHTEAEVSKKVDVYAFGITLWEILAHLPPWDKTRSSEFYRLVADGGRPEIPDVDFAAHGWCELMKACWHQEPKARPTFGTILSTLKNISEGAVITYQVSPVIINSCECELNDDVLHV